MAMAKCQIVFLVLNKTTVPLSEATHVFRILFVSRKKTSVRLSTYCVLND